MDPVDSQDAKLEEDFKFNPLERHNTRSVKDLELNHEEPKHTRT